MSTAYGCWPPPNPQCPVAPSTPQRPSAKQLSRSRPSALGTLLSKLMQCPALAADSDYANQVLAPLVLQLDAADQELQGLLAKYGWCRSLGFTRTLDLKGLQNALQKYQYVRIGVIGTGAYGTVHRALNRETREMQAIKQVKMTADGLCETTVREIATLRELQHPNIVRLHEVIAAPSSRYAYLVLELLDTDLHAFTHGRLRGAPEERPIVKSIMYQVLSGLRHAHSHSILHRDLKPQNILLGLGAQQGPAAPGGGGAAPAAATTGAAAATAPPGAATGAAAGGKALPVRVRAKIADFGLARPYLPEGPGARAYTDWVMTLYYRAPEVLLGCRRYGPGVDVWSAGCCLAEVLNAAPLFKADCEIALLQDVFRKLGTPGADVAAGVPELSKVQGAFSWFPPQPLAKLVPALQHDPAGLDLLARMLALNPAARISASQALAHPWFDEVRGAEGAAAAAAAAAASAAATAC